MNKEEIKKLLFYKGLVEKSKIELIEDFNELMSNLIEVDKKIDEELKKLKGGYICKN